MNNLMNFEGNSVEVFEWNGQVLFNPRHVGNCLELSDSAVRNYLAKMNKKQAIVLKNPDVRDKDIRKLNNAGEKFLTESGVYKLIFKSRKPEAERFSDWVADDVLPQIRKTGFYEMPEKEKNKKEKLSSVNQMAKNITGLLHEAGVDAKFIAAEVVRIYTDNGYPVHSPVITEDSKLWDCTSIAKELGILSTNGNPHDKAVSAIIQKLDLFADEIVRTAYSKNGHDGVTVQYKDSVLEKVKEWLEDNRYPTVIEYGLANGKSNNCKVVYDI
jgi:prophage antirepressor-like protein